MKTDPRRTFGTALKAYGRGDFNDSLVHFRAALASTLFWDRTAPEGLFRTFERVTKFVDIRIHMALCHYKLRWSPYVPPIKENYLLQRLKDAKENIDSANEVLEKQCGITISEVHRSTCKALSASMLLTKARMLYHDGKLLDALRILSDITHEKPPIIPARTNGVDDKESLIANLKLAVVFYYARCQMARVIYQLRGSPDDGAPKSWQATKEQQLKELKIAEDEVTQTCLRLAQYESTCGSSAEWKYYQRILNTIRQIAQWMVGRYATSVCRDVLPAKGERTPMALNGLQMPSNC